MIVDSEGRYQNALISIQHGIPETGEHLEKIKVNIIQSDSYWDKITLFRAEVFGVIYDLIKYKDPLFQKKVINMTSCMYKPQVKNPILALKQNITK